MSRGLSRQQIAILLFIRQREEDGHGHNAAPSSSDIMIHFWPGQARRRWSESRTYLEAPHSREVAVLRALRGLWSRGLVSPCRRDFQGHHWKTHVSVVTRCHNTYAAVTP